MDRRYLVALFISLLVLLVYPHYLQWIGLAPPKETAHKNIPLGQENALPPSPPPLPEADTVPYKNPLYEILFTARGGNVLLLKGEGAHLYKAGAGEKGIFGIRILNESEDLSGEIFEIEPSQGKDSVPSFKYEKPGEYRLTKRYFVGAKQPTLVLEAELQNLSEREKHFPMEFEYALELGPLHAQDEARVRAAYFSGGEIHLTGLRAIRKKGLASEGPFEWHGLLRKYYAILVKPDSKPIGQEVRFLGDELMAAVRFAPLSLGPGEKKTNRIFIYAGAQHYEVFRELGFGFEKIFSHGTLGLLRVGILITLNFFYRLVGNYGFAILLLTLLIKVLFTPLTHFSYQSMGKMQALQPKIKALQKQFQNDPSRLNKETMELYRRNRVNPLGGCLPMLLQIPIFIAFYQVLSDAVQLKGAGFIGWIHDLSEQDRLFSLPTPFPFIGNAVNLLPILMIGSMVWQQKLTPQASSTPGQEKLLYLTPLIFGFVFYNLPSGLVLYWLANNLLTIFHQLVIKRIPVVLHHEDS